MTHYTVTDMQECATACDTSIECRSFTYDAGDGQCNHYSVDEPLTIDGTEGQVQFGHRISGSCNPEMDTCEPEPQTPAPPKSCPPWYGRAPPNDGSVCNCCWVWPPSAQHSGEYKTMTAAKALDCGGLCDAEEGCQSWEWVPADNLCRLYDTTDPLAVADTAMTVNFGKASPETCGEHCRKF